MKVINKKSNEKLYTYTEFKNTFFPNLIFDNDSCQISKDSLLDMLVKTSSRRNPSSEKTIRSRRK
jgi:hypothetical protein